ncbi:MAG: hypothetical protein CVV53_07855 [Spirochaetae bacterium HGW-Spirochaetae-9]|nr:MAG: hypothetical protein CVV53_07855 [Spirochaetae bacterium HGW-Spirochaetae-9]
MFVNKFINIILANVAWGMPCWVVPLATFPEGYLGNPGQPLPLLATVGKKPDMGKSCLRFADTSRIPYELIGELASWITVDECIRLFDFI